MSPTVGTTPPSSPKDIPAPSSTAALGPAGQKDGLSKPSTSSGKAKPPTSQTNGTAESMPILEVNGAVPRVPHPPKGSTSAQGQDGDDTAWGSNFWVTLVDPQTQTSFFACPATGQVSWDAPVGHFVLPPSADGEWWELSDDSRDGLPYYYHTKTGETVWERPDGFVIPLGIIQNTALGRRLSTTFGRPLSTTDGLKLNGTSTLPHQPKDRQSYRRSNSYTDVDPRRHTPEPEHAQLRHSQTSTRLSTLPVAQSSPASGKKQPSAARRSFSSASDHHHGVAYIQRFHGPSEHLPPIPGSPYVTDGSTPPSPVSRKSSPTPPANNPKPKEKDSSDSKASPNGRSRAESLSRARPKTPTHVAHRPAPAQSLNAAVELLTSSSQSEWYSASDSNHSPNGRASTSTRPHTDGTMLDIPRTPLKDKSKRDVPPSPRRPIPAVPAGGTPFWARGASVPNVAGKEISGPMLNQEATMNMSPVKRSAGRPIPVEPRRQPHRTPTATLSTGTYPILPHDLASDIQQFSESDYARQYFSKHRTGFIFRRRVPVAQMMTWQKAPLTSPLLTLNRSLVKDAVKMFKVIQRIMGDRERDRAVGVRVQPDHHVSTVASINNPSMTSLGPGTVSVLEEERWLLGEGLTHGELRDEIYCQVMKQLSGNPNPESVFKGWQFMCVLLITFPPSKNFETYLHSYMQQRKTHQEGRVDVMAKYCLRRLAFIAKKGPRGKPPTTAEIETASDAAFNPSIFGESLGAIIRLQERNYPQQKVPIIMPFLADGILALGGTKSEGIFRVPGDGDSVSDLKLRIDRGYYTLDGVDDPHVLASLLKLWLRELCDPLVPEEMYNECITNSKDPVACVRIVERLPTINRRVVLFVISFLQLFLDDRIQSVTKMTPENLALVMAPNLLRCNSESMNVVYTNALYEQIFVYNLLSHLKCSEIDANYVPAHGLGAVPATPQLRSSKSRMRRPNH